MIKLEGKDENKWFGHVFIMQYMRHSHVNLNWIASGKELYIKKTEKLGKNTIATEMTGLVKYTDYVEMTCKE